MKQKQGEVIQGVYSELYNQGGVFIFSCLGNSPICVYVVKAKKTITGSNTFRYEPIEGETTIEFETNDGNDNFITHYSNSMIGTITNNSTEFEVR